MPKIITTLGSLLVTCVTAGAANSAPIMIAFEAVVSDIDGFSDAPVPLGAEVGSALKGTYTFDSRSSLDQVLAGGGGGGEAGSLTVSLDERQLDYTVNSGSLAKTGFGGLGVGGTTPPVTLLTLGFRPLNEGSVGALPSDAVLALTGPPEVFPPEVFSNPAKRADVANWNALADSRRLGLRFGPSGSIGATVGNFSVVPEPTTATSVCCVVATALSALRRHRSRSESSVIATHL